jgi:ribosomal protein S18 acetylase RimI-like enzyme
MNIRSIKSEEVGKFVQLSSYPERLAVVLGEFERSGESDPGKWWVAEQDGEFLAGLIYIGFSSHPHGLLLWDIFLPKDGDVDSIAKVLINRSIASFESVGITTIEAAVSSDDQDQKERRHILKTAGFHHHQAKWCYVHQGVFELGKSARRLTYRTLEEYGDDAFIELLELVTISTLDQGDLVEIKANGSRQAAVNYFNLLRVLDDQPHLWKVGMDGNQVVGLVVPQILSQDAAGINYLGVVPALRGRGYGLELLEEGTRCLREITTNKIYADIDVSNFPLERSLEIAGYTRLSELYLYRMDVGSRE